MDTKDAGRIGGKRRAAKMTPKQRIEAARKAVLARWAKAEKRNLNASGHTPPHFDDATQAWLRSMKNDLFPALARRR
jgi:hypothetical protein